MTAALAFVAGALAAAGTGVLLDPAVRRRRGPARGEQLLRVLARVGRRLRPGGGAAPGDLAARIAAAGRPADLGPRELMAAKLATCVAAATLGLALALGAPGRLGPALVAAAPVVGFLAPDLWLRRLAAERGRRVRRELPALLDLLRVSVEAGCSLPAALQAVGERSAGPLALEWRVVGRQVALGEPLEAALDGMLARLPLPEIRALVGALERARRHGSPLAETLAGQARDARFSLGRRVREDAARAGPQIQLVVALLLVPSVLLLVAAALVAALPAAGDGLVPL